MTPTATSADANPPSLPEPPITLRDIERAHELIAPFIHRTPLLTSRSIDDILDRILFGGDDDDRDGSSSNPRRPPRVRLAFKAEHVQKVGAFKMRGATNAILQLLPSSGDHSKRSLWVVTHSSGNHAAALACAASQVPGVRSAVVMPRNAPRVKVEAVRSYGALIVFCEPTPQAREEAASKLMRDIEEREGEGTVVHFVHPYDEPLVMAGQGTLGVEMVQQAKALSGGSSRACSHASEARARGGEAGEAKASEDPFKWNPRQTSEEPELDIVLGPVGGGGMLSGLSTAIKALDSRTIVIGAEPEGAADAVHSFREGKVHPAMVPPKTMCDGLLTPLSERTLAQIRSNVDDILLAREGDVKKALRLVWERMKQLIEPSAAVGLAVALGNARFKELARQVRERKVSEGRREEVRIGVVWTGGNLELEKVLAWLTAEDE